MTALFSESKHLSILTLSNAISKTPLLLTLHQSADSDLAVLLLTPTVFFATTIVAHNPLDSASASYPIFIVLWIVSILLSRFVMSRVAAYRQSTLCVKEFIHQVEVSVHLHLCGW